MVILIHAKAEEPLLLVLLVAATPTSHTRPSTLPRIFSSPFFLSAPFHFFPPKLNVCWKSGLEESVHLLFLQRVRLRS